MIAAIALALSCATNPIGTRTSAPLNCLDLVGVPEVPGASGIVALRCAPSPFGISIDAVGRTRYRLVATVAGLPEPRTLGDYSTYIAWAYTLSLDIAFKLGAVRNGTIELGEVSLMQFRILVTAERSVDVSRRSGRLVLRGTSPSALLVAHQDSRFFGVAPTTAGVGPVSMAMPGMHGAMPGAAPYVTGDSVITRPPGPAVIHAKTGDTLTLSAMSSSAMLGKHRTEQFGYDSRSPGPTVEVQQGSTVTVRVSNALPMPTSVHWHWIRLANPFDGAAGMTQAAIAPGCAFAYTLRFPDAGVFRYHPHVREDLQLGPGLFGNVRVRDRSKSRVRHHAGKRPKMQLPADSRIQVSCAVIPVRSAVTIVERCLLRQHVVQRGPTLSDLLTRCFQVLHTLGERTWRGFIPLREDIDTETVRLLWCVANTFELLVQQG